MPAKSDETALTHTLTTRSLGLYRISNPQFVGRPNQINRPFAKPPLMVSRRFVVVRVGLGVCCGVQIGFCGVLYVFIGCTRWFLVSKVVACVYWVVVQVY